MRRELEENLVCCGSGGRLGILVAGNEYQDGRHNATLDWETLVRKTVRQKEKKWVGPSRGGGWTS